MWQIPKTKIPLPKQSCIVALGLLEPEGRVITVAGITEEWMARLEVKEGGWVSKGEQLKLLKQFQKLTHSPCPKINTALCVKN